jgi:hypothetical protein
MKNTTSVFETLKVRQFLAPQFPYAEKCFREDFSKMETIPCSTVQKWFKTYFPSPTNFDLYRKLECQVVQIIFLKN